MINQHQFQQAAKHYRSGRISLNEFQSQVFAGRAEDTVIQRGDTIETLVNILSQLKTAEKPAIVTGVPDALGKKLSQQVADGKFDSATQTFAYNSSKAPDVPNSDAKAVAVIAVVNIGTDFDSGYLAGLVAEGGQ